jgi:16S rRNA processing protein RimM
MDKEDFYYLGKVLKPFGGKGHLSVLLDVDDAARYQKLETVFIGIDQNRIPYFISSFELRSSTRAILKFEDIDSADEASIFAGRELYLPLSMLPKLKGRKFYYHEITGFTVMDENRGNIGTVRSVLEFPHQPMLQVYLEDKEILIPMADEIILKVDRKKKEISIRAPEGLIDIYL